MNAKELSEATGLHENTIRNMIKRGELKAKKCGKYFVIDEQQARDLIFSKKSSSEKQDKVVGTYEIINLMEIKKKELFKDFMLSMVSVHQFPKKLYDINMEIGRGNISEEEGDEKIDLISDYYLNQFEQYFDIEKFKEYENLKISIEEVRKIQDVFLGKSDISPSSIFLDIEDKEM